MSSVQMIERPFPIVEKQSARAGYGGRFWMGILLWIAFVAISMLWIDHPVALWFSYTQPGKRLEKFLTFASFMGLYSIQILIFFIFLALPSRKKLMIGYYLPTFVSLLFCTALKMIIGRARPPALHGPYHFEFLHGYRHQMESLPSGEAAASMVLATLLGIYFPRMKWAFWFLALWNALGRVSKSVHFVSDVTLGAGLGFLCVYLCYKRLGPSYYPSLFGREAGKPAVADPMGV